MKATELYFPVVLFIMLYKVVLTFESVDEIVKCDYIQMKATEIDVFNFQKLFVNVDFLWFDLTYLSMIRYLEDFDQMIS